MVSEVKKRAIAKNLNEVIVPRSWSSARVSLLETTYRRTVFIENISQLLGGSCTMEDDAEAMSQEENLNQWQDQGKEGFYSNISVLGRLG